MCDTGILPSLTHSLTAFFLVFCMSIAFGGHVMAPFCTSFIVVVYCCSCLHVHNGVTKRWEVRHHVSNIHSETGTSVGGPNFCLARTKWHPILVLCFPSDRTSRSEYNCSTHISELKQGKLTSLSYCIPKLRPPTRVTVGWKPMVMIGFWRKSICVGFCIKGIREVHIRMKLSWVGGAKSNTIVNSRVDIM